MRRARNRCLQALVLAALLSTSRARAEIVISEILYNAPQGVEYEYVEICNTGDEAVDISGWSFTEGVEFVFPPDSAIPAGGYAVVCRSADAFRSAYPDVPEEVIFGDHTGRLANEGETLTLWDGVTQRSVTYGDTPPWDFLADGFGGSLERLCLSDPESGPVNWRAGPVPASLDEFGGTPGAPNSTTQCPPTLPTRPPVFISEIMYHPVQEESIEEQHEFVEIYNHGDESLDLDGWRLAGAIDFTFPVGTSIDAGEYRVIAKNRTLLAANTSYDLVGIEVLGDYDRNLDNGGEKVAVIGDDGQGVDVVTYDDDAPWPEAADALGAGRSWLSGDVLPVEDHQFMGVSLERVSFDVPSDEVANWAPSPLDGATPGAQNASARAVPLPVVAVILVRALGKTAEDPIRSTDQVQIQTSFTPARPSGVVELEYFVDDVEVSGEAVSTLEMFDDGVNGGDVAPNDGVIHGSLYRLDPPNSIVRYRIAADRGQGTEQVAPRPSDPRDWYAYFVAPVVNTTTRTYHVFISRANLDADVGQHRLRSRRRLQSESHLEQPRTGRFCPRRPGVRRLRAAPGQPLQSTERSERHVESPRTESPRSHARSQLACGVAAVSATGRS